VLPLPKNPYLENALLCSPLEVSVLLIMPNLSDYLFLTDSAELNTRYKLLSAGDKTNQQHFRKFLFHFIKTVVGIDFAHKKNLFLTSFTQCKLGLWKSCGFGFKISLNNI